MNGAILPGATSGVPGNVTLGVVGGGQLGRMFVHAAQAMGYLTAVLDPDQASPAGRVAHRHVRAGYLDAAGLAELGEHCAAVTTEFENVPAAALQSLSQRRRVAPGAAAVAVCQDRAAEKRLLQGSGVACAPYAVISAKDELLSIPDQLLPGILKTCRLGYDGKGQRRVDDRAALAAAWAALGQVPCVLEQRLALRQELSVVVARGSDGEIVHLPVQQNLHRDGILAVTQVPAPDASAVLQAQAVAAARQIASAMDYVGVLCVEFFVLSDGSLVANEMAPRPHNSGHWSIDGSDLSQFALQVRTLAGLPLVAPRQHSAAVMLNLLGELWFDTQGRPHTPDWAGVLALPGTHLHLYAKDEARPGRKMGHLTITAPDLPAANAVARQAAALLGLPTAW